MFAKQFKVIHKKCNIINLFDDGSKRKSWIKCPQSHCSTCTCIYIYIVQAVFIIHYVQVSGAIGSQLDFIATFADVAGLSAAKLINKTLDSVSLLPLLLEDKPS